MKVAANPGDGPVPSHLDEAQGALRSLTDSTKAVLKELREERYVWLGFCYSGGVPSSVVGLGNFSLADPGFLRAIQW